MGDGKIRLLVFFLLWVSFFSLGSPISSSYSIIGYEPEDLVSEERIVELFERWREKHGKVYRKEEEEKRLRAFTKNLEYVNERNRRKGSQQGHWVGLNKFADMSNEEFKEVYSTKILKPKKKRSEKKRKSVNCGAPSSLDWRKKGIVTGVKNQGNCGSCWAFSTTGAIEGINAIVTGDLISLSEQELVDCDSTNEGCDGGYMDYAFEWVILNGGIDTESDYTYTGKDGNCNITKEESKVVTIDGYEDVEEEESALLCAVVNQPISVGIDGSALDFQLYTGGIYDGLCSSDPDNIDHAVLIVGYGSEGDEDYWIVKNSWGKSWGMKGYIYIKRNTNLEHGVCAINAEASYPTKESSSSPSPYPSPYVPPPPSPPPPPPPPPPSPPTPVQCGDFSYCDAGETCCCIFEIYNICLIYGCCEYENAVCCAGTEYCCPEDYPICDVEDGLCLQNYKDMMGVAAKKRRCAHHKLPWTKHQHTEKAPNSYHPIQWRRNQFAALQ